MLRSWLRLIAKRDGAARAERARRWLYWALRVTGQRDAAAWACSGSIVALRSGRRNRAGDDGLGAGAAGPMINPNPRPREDLFHGEEA